MARARGAAAAAACGGGSLMASRPPLGFLLVAVVAILAVAFVAPARSAWVDYPSGVPCGVTIPVEQCDPTDAAANSACRDMCHYGGCRRGGKCVSLGLGAGRGCHCKC